MADARCESMKGENMAKEMTREECEKLIRAREDELKDNERDCENCEFHSEKGCTKWVCAHEEEPEDDAEEVGELLAFLYDIFSSGYDAGYAEGKKYRKKAKRWKRKYLEFRHRMYGLANALDTDDTGFWNSKRVAKYIRDSEDRYDKQTSG